MIESSSHLLRNDPVDLEEKDGVWKKPENPPAKSSEPAGAPNLRKERTLEVESTTPLAAPPERHDVSSDGHHAESEPPVPSKPAILEGADPVPTVAGYKIHPLALAFPAMSAKEIAALTESICAIGQQQPAVLHEDMLLDGRGRGTACDRLGIPLRTTLLPEGVNPVDFVVAVNIQRRHLNATQRAVAATKLMPYYQAEAAMRKQVLSGTRANPDGTQPEVTENLPEPDACGEAREKAAEATGANEHYVTDLLRIQRKAPELFRAVESGKMSIPKALKELEKQCNERPEQEAGLTRNEFLALLWDSSGSKPTRAPEKSYNGKVYPNLAFFHLHQPGDFEFGDCSQYGLTRIALFVVPVEPTEKISGKNGFSFFKASCRYGTLSVRGNVPEPPAIPGLIIDNGYDGVVKMITSMFPTALKAVSTTRAEAPSGWQLVPRECKESTSPNASGVAPDSTKRTQTLSADVHTTPAGAAGAPKAVNKTPATVEKAPKRRKAKLATVLDHVSNLHDGLCSITTELRQILKKHPEHRHLSSYKDREESVTRLDAATTQLAQIIASLGVPSEEHHDESASIGELPFTTQISARGSRLNRVRHTTEIVIALAKAIEAPAPNIAQQLKNVVTELESRNLRRGL